jgi:hypothetical protein
VSLQPARIVLYAAEGLVDTEIAAARLDTTPGIVARWRRPAQPVFAY